MHCNAFFTSVCSLKCIAFLRVEVKSHCNYFFFLFTSVCSPNNALHFCKKRSNPNTVQCIFFLFTSACSSKMHFDLCLHPKNALQLIPLSIYLPSSPRSWSKHPLKRGSWLKKWRFVGLTFDWGSAGLITHTFQKRKILEIKIHQFVGLSAKYWKDFLDFRFLQNKGRREFICCTFCQIMEGGKNLLDFPSNNGRKEEFVGLSAK